MDIYICTIIYIDTMYMFEAYVCDIHPIPEMNSIGHRDYCIYPIVYVYVLIYLYIINILHFHVIEGSLEVKLPTIWTDEKQSRAEAERRGRLVERRSEEKE